MRKALLTIPFVILMAIILISPAQAVSVTIKVEPEVIWVGEKVTITITVDEDAVGWIYVYEPDGDYFYVDFMLDFPDFASVSYVYPDDFPDNPWNYYHTSPSTSELGYYDVEIDIGGVQWWGWFWVTFFVIPEFPLGTIMAVVAPLGAVAGLATIKRSRLKR